MLTTCAWVTSAHPKRSKWQELDQAGGTSRFLLQIEKADATSSWKYPSYHVLVWNLLNGYHDYIDDFSVLAEKYLNGLWNRDRKTLGKCFWELQVIRWKLPFRVGTHIWSGARISFNSTCSSCSDFLPSSWYIVSRRTRNFEELP